jgi:prepilin-type processing-associated H-X9-DG protein
MYLQDYDEVLPAVYIDRPTSANRVRWHQLLDPYIKNNNVRFCPSDAGSKNVADGNLSSYAALMNGHIFVENSGGAGQRTLAQLTKVADLGFAVDANSWYCYYHPCNPASNQANLSSTTGDWKYLSRHSEGTNCAYLDGHVKWQKASGLVNNRDFWGCNGL